MVGDCAPMAEEINGNQVGGRRQLGTCKLCPIQVTTCHEGVSKDDSRLRWIVFIWHLVGGLNATEVGYVNRLEVAAHCDRCGCMLPEWNDKACGNWGREIKARALSFISGK